jgi:ABC-type hemin transport system substrate-binding protein
MLDEFQKGIADSTITPKEWLQKSYLKIDAALDTMMMNVKTNELKKEMDDYIKENSDDELAKAIWLVANYDARKWMIMGNAYQERNATA